MPAGLIEIIIYSFIIGLPALALVAAAIGHIKAQKIPEIVD
jgi:hypothetical protein